MTDPTIARLLDEVYAHPTDDAARQVLADALLGAGDPRGELIALQLAGADPDHVRKLVAAHGREWVQPLASFAWRVELGRGFPVRVELASWLALDGEGWEAARDAPALATLEEILQGRARDGLFAKMLGSPRLVALRAFEVVDERTARVLEAVPARITRLAVSRPHGDAAAALAGLRPELARRPEIRELDIALAAFGGLGASIEQLDTLAVAGPVPNVLALWSRVPAGVTLVRTHPGEPRGLGDTPLPTQIRLSRDGGRTHVHARGDVLGTLARFFDQLPADTRTLEISGSPKTEVDALLPLAAARGLEVTTSPLRRPPILPTVDLVTIGPAGRRPRT